MIRNQLICDLIAKILELSFLIVTAVNLKDISRHLCCDMDSAIIWIVVFFSLLSLCVLFQIALDVIYLIKFKGCKYDRKSKSKSSR